MRFIDDDAKTASTSSAIRKAVEQRQAKASVYRLALANLHIACALAMAHWLLPMMMMMAMLSFLFLYFNLPTWYFHWFHVRLPLSSVSRWQSLTLPACLAGWLSGSLADIWIRLSLSLSLSLSLAWFAWFVVSRVVLALSIALTALALALAALAISSTGTLCLPV